MKKIVNIYVVLFTLLTVAVLTMPQWMDFHKTNQLVTCYFIGGLGLVACVQIIYWQAFKDGFNDGLDQGMEDAQGLLNQMATLIPPNKTNGNVVHMNRQYASFPVPDDERIPTCPNCGSEDVLMGKETGFCNTCEKSEDLSLF